MSGKSSCHRNLCSPPLISRVDLTHKVRLTPHQVMCSISVHIRPSLKWGFHHVWWFDIIKMSESCRVKHFNWTHASVWSVLSFSVWAFTVFYRALQFPRDSFPTQSSDGTWLQEQQLNTLYLTQAARSPVSLPIHMAASIKRGVAMETPKALAERPSHIIKRILVSQTHTHTRIEESLLEGFSNSKH